LDGSFLLLLLLVDLGLRHGHLMMRTSRHHGTY
jgi:hypothetical protein